MIQPLLRRETGSGAVASMRVSRMLLRIALAASFIALAGDGALFGQIGYPGGGVGYPGGGIGYPGGGYPGGVGYPGGGGMGIPGIPGGGRRRGQSNVPTDTFSGKINRISSSQLVLDQDDGTQLQISLDRNTRYVNTSGGTARYGDFDTGDRVSIDAARDNQSYLHALRVTMQEKGSASGKSGTQTSSNDSPKSSSPSDDDPDRPRLKRSPNSSSSDSDAAASASGPSAPRPQSTNSDARTVADNRPPTSIAPKPVARESDDPGPPVLKRNAPARVDNTPPAGAEATNSDPVAQAQAIADRYKNGVPEIASARPSIKAEEANGVTKGPAPPKIGPAEAPTETDRPSTASSPLAGPRSSDPVIQGAREAAFQFTETLPNYVVKQFTTRYQTDAAHGNRTSWQALDVVTADVVCENGKESYKNILVNGKAPKDDIEKTGSWSTGEFATVLQGILAPYTDADFHNKRSTTINNRTAYRYDYAVEQKNSGWHVYASSESYVPGYTGSIWIDKETSRVLRIEMSAVNMPKSFALDAVESAVDYDFVMIAEQKYLLPTHSEALSCVRGTAECTRNVIEFRNYRKFGADSSITFDKP